MGTGTSGTLGGAGRAGSYSRTKQLGMGRAAEEQAGDQPE